MKLLTRLLMLVLATTLLGTGAIPIRADSQGTADQSNNRYWTFVESWLHSVERAR